MQQALELSKSYAGKPGIPRILATAGIHPHEAQFANQAALQKLDDLLADPDVWPWVRSVSIIIMTTRRASSRSRLSRSKWK